MPGRTVTLGGRTFDVRPLTIDDLDALWPYWEGLGDKERVIKSQRAIIEAAVLNREGDPKLGAVEGVTYPEMADACDLIAELSGLVAMGERAARRAESLTSAISAPGLPPLPGGPSEKPAP